MTNQERIKEYLVGEKGYLKSDISNGKVIMLSGKWGSGKTHFWQNEISEVLKINLKKEEKAYSYISLYGKSSITEIENDIFGQVYYDAIGGENLVTKTASTFTKLTKRYGGFSSLLDFSKLAEAGEEDQKDNIERTALSRLNNGGIICFDDFERKSKDIDLNDLFGFITQLTLNFNCKVVIILNDDVFEGEEKDIFSNVKEKTVFKFLKYEPRIYELLELIFSSDEKYSALLEYKKDILLSLTKAQELNARIYKQILENILEWVEDKKEFTGKYIPYFILTNINFIVNHCIFSLEHRIQESIPNLRKGTFYKKNNALYFFSTYNNKNKDFFEVMNKIDERELGFSKDFSVLTKLNDSVLSDNEIRGIYFTFTLKNVVFNDMDVSLINQINNFIETGILIDE